MSTSSKLHHVAFATRDVEATYEFYAKRLGLPLVHAENHASGGGWMRHFFFDIGNGESIAFFAFEGIGEKDGWRSDVSTGAGLPVWVNHVAFNVDGVDALAAMKRRCETEGVELLMETDHGWCRSIYLLDPNGIMVEFTTTTDSAAFEQGEEEALRRLRISPEDFPPESRKDTSTTVSANKALLRKATPKEPAK